MRTSIPATYDSRESGPGYHVTTRIGNRNVEFRRLMADPFVTTTVTVGWRDLLRALVHRSLDITVLVDGDKDRVDDVLELDSNTLIPDSTRRQAWDAQVSDALGAVGTEEDQ